MYDVALGMLLVGALMLFDYALTLVGFSFYEKSCMNHIKIESYELNPFFRNAIKTHRYSMRHALSVLLVLGFLFFAFEFSRILSVPWIFVLLLGVFVGIFGFMNYRHLRNIFVFRSLIKYPEDIQGVIRKGKHHLYERAKADAFGLCIFLALLCVLTPSFILAGATLGVLIVFIQNQAWEAKLENHSST